MNNNVQTVFISGANRGIGKGLALQLSNRACQVIAGYRTESRSTDLLAEAQKRDNLFPFKVDVTSESDLKELYTFIANQFGYLDILINNAGINLTRSRKINELEWSDIAHHFKVNVGGAFLATKYLYPFIKAGQSKKIVNISSKLASIELSSGGGTTPYNVSKASLNMLTKQQAIEYRIDGITAISLSPGWVRTDMGGGAAPLSVQESATRILKVIDTLSLSRTGQFMDVDGELLPY